MNVNGIAKSIRPMYQGVGIKRRIFDMLPNMTVKDRPFLNNLGIY